MTKILRPFEKEVSGVQEAAKGISRRSFFAYAGISVAATALVLSGCKKDNDGPMDPMAVDLGSGDFGVLNYAYALEQLEAAFYAQVMQTQFSGITDEEKRILSDLRDHEAIHRDFLKAALGTNAIQNLEFDFSTVDFSSRNSVLQTARTFEDLGVSAYNGAGMLLTNPDLLLIAGKIVSVEARHASVIRDLITMGTFASDKTTAGGIIDENGLDLVSAPADVLAAADTFIKTKINANNLPTS